MLQIETNDSLGLTKNKKAACDPVEGLVCARQGIRG